MLQIIVPQDSSPQTHAGAITDDGKFVLFSTSNKNTYVYDLQPDQSYDLNHNFTTTAVV